MNKPSRIPYPAAEVGVASYPVPHVGYIVLVEKLSLEKQPYEPLDPTQTEIYSGLDAGDYPTLYLIQQTPDQTGKWLHRYWASDRAANVQNCWNYRMESMGDDVAFPQYIRELIVPRDTYTPAAKFTTKVGSLLGVQITNQGSGYTTATIGFAGSNAAAICRIQSGKVIAAYLTDPGSTITGTPTATITGDGTSAAATPIWQPASSVLVKELRAELPTEDPMHGRYIKVTQVYMTLPGPWLTKTSWTEDGVVQTQKRRLNIAANIAEAWTIAAGIESKTTREVSDDSSIVAFELVETRAVPGLVLTEKKVNKETNGNIVISRQIVVAGSVTEGTVIGPGATPEYFDVIEELIIDTKKSWRVNTREFLPAARDINTAIRSAGSTGMKYPDVCDVWLSGMYNNAFAVVTGGKADMVPAYHYTYYVISPTEPILDDQVQADQIIDLNAYYDGANYYPNVLSDAYTLLYSTAIQGPSKPSATQYRGIQTIIAWPYIDRSGAVQIGNKVRWTLQADSWINKEKIIGEVTVEQISNTVMWRIIVHKAKYLAPGWVQVVDNTLPTKILGPFVAQASVGIQFVCEIQTQGPPATITTSELPAGLSLSGNLLYGAPDTGGVGLNNISVTATSPTGSDTKILALSIVLGPPVVTSTSPLPDGTWFVPYTYTFTASGSPTLWATSWESLTTGMMFDPTTGIFHGEPVLVPGAYSITVTPINALGYGTPVAFAWHVAPAFIPIIDTTGFNYPPVIPAGSTGATPIATVPGSFPTSWTSDWTPGLCGLTFNTTTGALEGTATVGGGDITVTATNELGTCLPFIIPISVV